MILRLACPICNKDSYSASVVNFRPCPYCGISFSGKYGRERRTALRIKKKMSIHLVCKDYESEASVLDFSQNGISMTISGRIIPTVGDAVLLIVKGSALKASVKWVIKGDDPSYITIGFSIPDGGTRPDPIHGIRRRSGTR